MGLSLTCSRQIILSCLALVLWNLSVSTWAAAVVEIKGVEPIADGARTHEPVTTLGKTSLGREENEERLYESRGALFHTTEQLVGPTEHPDGNPQLQPMASGKWKILEKIKRKLRALLMKLQNAWAQFLGNYIHPATNSESRAKPKIDTHPAKGFGTHPPTDLDSNSKPSIEIHPEPATDSSPAPDIDIDVERGTISDRYEAPEIEIHSIPDNSLQTIAAEDSYLDNLLDHHGLKFSEGGLTSLEAVKSWMHSLKVKLSSKPAGMQSLDEEAEVQLVLTYLVEKLKKIAEPTALKSPEHQVLEIVGMVRSPHRYRLTSYIRAIHEDALKFSQKFITRSEALESYQSKLNDVGHQLQVAHVAGNVKEYQNFVNSGLEVIKNLKESAHEAILKGQTDSELAALCLLSKVTRSLLQSGKPLNHHVEVLETAAKEALIGLIRTEPKYQWPCTTWERYLFGSPWGSDYLLLMEYLRFLNLGEGPHVGYLTADKIASKSQSVKHLLEEHTQRDEDHMYSLPWSHPFFNAKQN